MIAWILRRLDRVSDNSLCKSKSAQDPDSPSSSQTVLRVRHIQRLIGRPPLVSIVGLVAQVPGRLNTLVSPGEDLDAQALLVLHWDDLFGCRCSETAESHDFSGRTWRNSFSACRQNSRQTGHTRFRGRLHGFREHVLRSPVGRVRKLQGPLDLFSVLGR